MTNCELRALFPDVNFRYADCDTMPGQIPAYLQEFAREGYFGLGLSGCGSAYSGCGSECNGCGGSYCGPIYNPVGVVPATLQTSYTPVVDQCNPCITPLDTRIQSACNSTRIGCARPRRRKCCKCCCCCCCCGGGGINPYERRCNFKFSAQSSTTADGISGAKFVVTSGIGDTQTLETDANGYATAQLLPNVDYTMRQTGGPLGMNIDSTAHTVRVDANCNVYVDGVLTQNFVVYNAPLVPAVTANFSFTKVSAEDQSTLAGAMFTLSSDTLGTAIAYSGADGKVNFSNLAPGTYTLREPVQPSGFEPNSKTYTVVVTSTGDVLVDNASASTFSVPNTPNDT